MARSRAVPSVSIADRVQSALARGTLAQWLLLDTAEQVAEAKALLAAAKAKHIEAVTPEQAARRQAKAEAEVTARAIAFAKPMERLVEPVEAEPPKPTAPRAKPVPVAAAPMPAMPARRQKSHHPVPIAAE